jgi:hypothetical protein
MKRALALGVILLAGLPLRPANPGMKTAVAAVESHFGVRHHGVPLPLLWVAKPFLIRAGVGGLRIATFEDFRGDGSIAIDQVVSKALGAEWSLFLEARSRHERTNIYVRPQGARLAMLIATLEDNELTLIQMNCSGRALHHWINEPVGSAHNGKHKGNRSAEPSAGSEGNEETQAEKREPI